MKKRSEMSLNERVSTEIEKAMLEKKYGIGLRSMGLFKLLKLYLAQKIEIGEMMKKEFEEKEKKMEVGFRPTYSFIDETSFKA